MNERLGDFEVLRELGRGGMGIVYEARQVSLNRKVALKVLSGGLGLTGNSVTRFKREAEAAAKLHHTNIVPIYATGEEDGTHFYAMELIEGPSLDKVIKQMRREAESRVESRGSKGQKLIVEGRVSSVEMDDSESNIATTCIDSQRQSSAKTAPDSRPSILGSTFPAFDSRPSTLDSTSGSSYFDTIARIIAEVADGLDYAHKQGVIHRDIKPSNLLLSADGRLHINDFGLARMLEEPGMTISGEFLGSPSYMSPEQIAAGRLPLDHRTDIYSLGVVLYELLALQPPLTGQSRAEAMLDFIPMTAELADAKKAVSDAEFANGLLSNNPFALATSAQAYLWVARLQEGKETRPGARKQSRQRGPE